LAPRETACMLRYAGNAQASIQDRILTELRSTRIEWRLPNKDSARITPFSYVPKRQFSRKAFRLDFQTAVVARKEPWLQKILPGLLSAIAGLFLISGFLKSSYTPPVRSKKVLRGGFEAAGFDVVFADEEGPIREPPGAYKVHKITGDGRCLFRAIVQGMSRIDSTPLHNLMETIKADELRSQVADRMPQYRKKFEQFHVLEGSFEDYIRKLRQPSFWGGEPELLVMTDILQTPIYVYIRDKSRNFVAIQIYGKAYEFARKPVRVFYNGQSHYDLLL